MTHLIDITQGWCPECREPFLVVPNTPNLALLAIKQEFEEYQSLRAAEEAELRRQVAEERRLLARERAELDRRRTLSRPMVDFLHSDSPPPRSSIGPRHRPIPRLRRPEVVATVRHTAVAESVPGHRPQHPTVSRLGKPVLFGLTRAPGCACWSPYHPRKKNKEAHPCD